MSVQNVCFDRLFNKKNDMKYFKNLIIMQVWATVYNYLHTFKVNLIKSVESCLWQCLVVANQFAAFKKKKKNGRHAPSLAFLKNRRCTLTLDI